ncbi:MAG: type II glyceraldehyde-3-phosphate dehydrogenase [Methanosarcinales archaeon]
MAKVKVAINGYGTIGKRVADAISLQDDMEVIGVAKTRPNFEAKLAVEKGYNLYAAAAEQLDSFKKAKVPVQGTIKDLLKEADIVVDCTPGGVGATYKPVYEKHNNKAIWEGGEKHDLTGLSFNASCNYKDAIGKTRLRVVSCNTTGLCRVINAVDKKFGVKKARVTLMRRAADPGDSKRGPINAIIPDPVSLPSHHGPDVQTVLPHINIATMAVKLPTTLMHLHAINMELKTEATAEDLKNTFAETPRIRFVSVADGIKSSAEVIEYGRDLGRPRNDFWENIVWEDSISISDGELYFFQGIHQEADVIPENIDAIRALMELETDAEKSIAKTNKAMGIS